MKTFALLCGLVFFTGCARVIVKSETLPALGGKKLMKVTAAEPTVQLEEPYFEMLEKEGFDGAFEYLTPFVGETLAMTSTSRFENPGTGFTPVYTTDKTLCFGKVRAILYDVKTRSRVWNASMVIEDACHPSLRCRLLEKVTNQAIEDGVVDEKNRVKPTYFCPSETARQVAAASPSKN